MAFVIPAYAIDAFSAKKNRCRDGAGMRVKPERVVLDVREGVKPSPKPPVRIFLGTEPAQYRAERVFIWSIERVRDPSRVYEIHLMKELYGFDRRKWLTGFTNYRFAIPHFAGGEGRAIWNDVDQAYLTDPAELFDADMGDHALLMIPPLSPAALPDSSVMLLDCARMKEVWSLEDAQHGRKNALVKKALAMPGLCGFLAPAWNARDEEYVPGRSRLLHWTILHTQPWHPLPGLFVYQRNPVGHVWHELKRSADEAGFLTFTAAHPSSHYQKLVARLDADRNSGRGNKVGTPQASGLSCAADLRDLLRKTSVKTILDCHICEEAGDSAVRMPCDQEGLTVTRCDLARASSEEPLEGGFDGVLCTQSLDWIPDEDVPWVVERLFRSARKFVYAAVSDFSPARRLADGTRLSGHHRSESWWIDHFSIAAAQHPDVHWKLVARRRGTGRRGLYTLREAGRWLGKPPEVWTLADHDPAKAEEAMALAQALGWRHEIRDISAASKLTPPWPDVVVAASGRALAAARRIKEKSGGRTRLVALGPESPAGKRAIDAVVTPAYWRLPPHFRRIETTTVPSGITEDRLARASEQHPRLFGDAPRPHILLVIGGLNGRYRLDAEAARRMGEEVRSIVSGAGGYLGVMAGLEIRSGILGGLVAGLGEFTHLYSGHPGCDGDDKYVAYLAQADRIIVAGGDESLLADAAASGKPVQIFPLPGHDRRALGRLREWVLAHSEARPLNRRGTVRPQQGLEYLSARLIERGTIRPPVDFDALEQSLIRLGVVSSFDARLSATSNRPGLREAEEAAAKVRELLGIPENTSRNDEKNATIQLVEPSSVDRDKESKSVTYLDWEQLDQLDPIAFRAQKPFPWINPKSALTDDGYRRLVETLPDLSLFEESFGVHRWHGQQSHDRYALEYREDLGISEPWRAFIAELTGERYRSFLSKMLGVARFDLNFHWHYAPRGCSVSPHCDARRKYGSHVFYFNTPSDWDPDWGGQTLVLDDHERLRAGTNPVFEDFVCVAASEPVGNSSLLFRRTEHSWHGVRPLACPEGVLRKVFIVVVNDVTPVVRLRRIVGDLPAGR